MTLLIKEIFASKTQKYSNQHFDPNLTRISNSVPVLSICFLFELFFPVQHSLSQMQSTTKTASGSIPRFFYSAVDFSKFARSGGIEVTPTSLCCSPWSPTLQYGGNVACLLYSGLQAQLPPNQSSMSLCHFTLSFFKPIPLQTLVIAPGAPLRLGNKVVHLQVSLFGGRSSGEAEGEEVARAVGVFRREQDVTKYGATENPKKLVPLQKIDELIPVFGEGAQSASPNIAGSKVPHFEKTGVGFFWAQDFRVPRSMLNHKPGDKTEYWTKLKSPVFEHEDKVDPIHRLLMLGEGSGGLTSFLPLNKFSFVNPVFSCTVLRKPSSEWVSLRGSTQVDPATGAGLVTTTMFDEFGLCAAISQPQMVESWEMLKLKKR